MGKTYINASGILEKTLRKNNVCTTILILNFFMKSILSQIIKTVPINTLKYTILTSVHSQQQFTLKRK